MSAQLQYINDIVSTPTTLDKLLIISGVGVHKHYDISNNIKVFRFEYRKGLSMPTLYYINY